MAKKTNNVSPKTDWTIESLCNDILTNAVELKTPLIPVPEKKHGYKLNYYKASTKRYCISAIIRNAIAKGLITGYEPMTDWLIYYRPECGIPEETVIKALNQAIDTAVKNWKASFSK